MSFTPRVGADHYRFQTLMKPGTLQSACVHAAFALLFFLIGARYLAWFNVAFSVPFYVISYLTIDKRFQKTSACLANLEVILHSVLATYFVGWNSGFHLYVLLLVPIAFFDSQVGTRLQVLLAASAGLAYLLLVSFLQGNASYYAVHPFVLRLVNLLNYVVFLSWLSVGCYRYYRITRDAESRLKVMSRTDELTRLANRRRGIEELEHEQKRFARNHRPFSIMLADIDDFKRINDEFGHNGGDFVLTTVADALCSGTRDVDCVTRWGGEEFLILLPETGRNGAEIVAERLRAGIAQLACIYQGRKVTITVTIGVSEYAEREDLDRFIQKADGAMYRGKAQGKNRVIVA